MRKFKYFQPGGEIEYKPGTSVVDLADIDTNKPRWYNPFSWFGGNDAADLAQQGFIYQDPTTGKLTKFSGTEDELRAQIKAAKKREALGQKYGLTPEEQQWDENAQALRRHMISNNNRIHNLVEKRTQATTNPTKSKSYKYSLDKNSSELYKNVLNTLYNNKQYDILNSIIGNNESITTQAIKDYFNTQQNYNSAWGITEDQYNQMRTTTPVQPTLQPAQFTPTTDWESKYKAGWTNYAGVTNEARARAMQAAYGFAGNSIDGINGTNTSRVLNGMPGAEENFYGDYYMFNNGDQRYYVGANGKTYNASGEEVGHTYDPNTKKHIITTTSTFKKGGLMKYFQMGGAVNQQQVAREQSMQQREVLKSAFTAAASGDLQTLSKVLGITSKEQLSQFIQIADKISKQKDADPEMAELASKALMGIQQAINAGGTMAKKGAKLEYIQRLRGKCPEGYEMEMFKVGGKVGCKCKKKAEEGVKLEDGGESPVVQQFKKGRKCKK